jgi:hypothetical protein
MDSPFFRPMGFFYCPRRQTPSRTCHDIAKNWCMCVSYRALNQVTLPFEYPIPRCSCLLLFLPAAVTAAVALLLMLLRCCCCCPVRCSVTAAAVTAAAALLPLLFCPLSVSCCYFLATLALSNDVRIMTSVRCHLAEAPPPPPDWSSCQS